MTRRCAPAKREDLDQETVAKHCPSLVHVSVLPFGASGPKADWDGEEVNLLHAGGEGFLLPNGLSNELFPDRPPLKIYGHFAGYQGGSMAAFAALAAWWALPRRRRPVCRCVGAGRGAVGRRVRLQRLGDGSLEHRSTRRFRYGGVFEAQGGFVEVPDARRSSVECPGDLLLGSPAWAQDEALAGSLGAQPARR